MENWKLLLPQGELEIKTSRHGSSTALLLAGGRKPAPNPAGTLSAGW